MITIVIIYHLTKHTRTIYIWMSQSYRQKTIKFHNRGANKYRGNSSTAIRSSWPFHSDSQLKMRKECFSTSRLHNFGKQINQKCETFPSDVLLAMRIPISSKSGLTFDIQNAYFEATIFFCKTRLRKNVENTPLHVCKPIRGSVIFGLLICSATVWLWGEGCQL